LLLRCERTRKKKENKPLFLIDETDYECHVRQTVNK